MASSLPVRENVGTSLYDRAMICSCVSCNKWTFIWSKLYCPTEGQEMEHIYQCSAQQGTRSWPWKSRVTWTIEVLSKSNYFSIHNARKPYTPARVDPTRFFSWRRWWPLNRSARAEISFYAQSCSDLTAPEGRFFKGG
jgi:hypothetical protein